MVLRLNRAVVTSAGVTWTGGVAKGFRTAGDKRHQLPVCYRVEADGPPSASETNSTVTLLMLPLDGSKQPYVG